MNFDLSKENIQPLRGGRNVLQLGVALQAQTNAELQTTILQERESYEARINAYDGDDPLALWYEYISWIEQTYPKQGHEGNLVPLLEQCLSIFAEDEKYRHDIRHCKLFIKFVDYQSNPAELLRMAYHKGLFIGLTQFYKAWAYYHEALGDYQTAHKIFELGKHNLAQPADELFDAHKNLVMAAGEHMLHEGQVDQSGLVERRQALTSLQAYKPNRVGNIRVAAASGPGIIGAGSSSALQSNAPIPIYEGENGATGVAAAPINILSVARRSESTKENIIKPGPWTTVPVKKRHLGQKQAPSFTVLEDSFDGKQDLHSGFPRETLENYSDWIVNLIIAEPRDERMIPMYPKKQVYAEISNEYCLEEIRARRYKKKVDVMDYSVISGKEQIQEQHSIHNQFNNITQQPIIQPEIFSPVCPSTTGYNPIWDNNQTNVASFHLQSPLVVKDKPNESIHEQNFLTCEAKNVAAAAATATASFQIYEQASVLVENAGPKGSAMKTPFKDLNAEELAETGSRGGMDIAAAAPVDSAKRLENFDDENSSPFNVNDLSCNTQMFNLIHLNNMRVSTPKEKPTGFLVYEDDATTVDTARKQLFNEPAVGQQQQQEQQENKILSIILEETKSYGSSSGSSKSTVNSQAKPVEMATISEEHNSYLAQNLMANAELRRSLLGTIGDFHSPASPAAMPSTSETKTTPTKTNLITRRSSPITTTTTNTSMAIPINYIPSDPFKQSLIDDLLRRINFPGPHMEGYYIIPNIPKLSNRKESVQIGPHRYVIENQLGRGTFGTVVRCIDIETGKNMALKLQRPANKWEFYICRELQKRLANHPLRDRFMDVRIGYFSDQASILISDYMPHGSLLNVVNMVKTKSGKTMKESLCIYFSLEMLKVVSTLHQAQIIHADIKPDNFLIKLLPNDSIQLQLIDFGCSIDMTLFPSNASFTRKVNTANFICCEMQDGKRWNYHTDLFCVAATTHVLLFDKYLEMKKSGGNWSISQRMPRYIRVDLWNTFFSTLLNQQNGPADTTALQALLQDSLNHVFDDYYTDVRYLFNILKNR